MRENLPPPPDTHQEGVEAARDIAAAVTCQSEAIHDALAAPIREGGYTLDQVKAGLPLKLQGELQ